MSFFEGGVSTLRILSDRTLTDFCNYYPLLAVNISDINTANLNNRGNIPQDFSTVFLNVPCRMDNEVTTVDNQRSKDRINTAREPRFLYLSLSWLQDNQLSPKKNDEFETNAGNPLGIQIRYRVTEVGTETEEVDVQLTVMALE